MSISVWDQENDPSAVLARAQHRAILLAQVVEKQKLALKIGASTHLRFEAWQLLGGFYGVTPIVTELTEERDADGRLMRVRVRAEARWRGETVLSAAESECARNEELTTKSGKIYKRWEKSTDAQIKGMAQTRACARALRHCLAWIAVLAGFSPTPAEEMET